MSTLIAIDPGLRAAHALFLDGRLLRCGQGVPLERVDRIVIEKPFVYPHSPVPPNDIVALAIQAGLVATRLGDFNSKVPEWVEPRKWKGQVPKPKSGKWVDYVIHRRVVAALDGYERVVYAEATDKVPPKSCDLSDAVGLGLWALGRFG